MTFHAKTAMSDLKRFPLNPNLINTVEVIISFIQVSKCLTLTIHMSSPAVEMR